MGVDVRIWYDTEFYEDGRTIELISIGLVREDGAEYYAETILGAHFASRSQWLRDNVLRHLRQGDAVKTTNTIRNEILAFAGDKPEFWAYYADYDWVVLCQLFGRMIDLPNNWPKWCRDLKQLATYHGVQLPAQEGIEHHALADAKWLRDAHLWCEQYINTNGL